MNKCCIGEFGQELENHFIKDINKAQNSLVITPSGILSRHLASEYLRYNSLTATDVNFISYNLLIKKLADHSDCKSNFVESDYYYSVLLREWFNNKKRPCDLRSALRFYETIKDLQESAVEPHHLKNLAKETNCPQHVGLTIDALKFLNDKTRESDIVNINGLTQYITKTLEFNKYLQTFNSIFIYGFYDLNQNQIDLFMQMIRLNKRFVIYLPADVTDKLQINRSIYDYAKPFIQSLFLPNIASRKDFSLQHIGHKLTGIEDSINSCLEQIASKPNKDIELISVSGAFEMILHTLHTAKTLITKGAKPSSIAIIARNSERYSFLASKISDFMGLPFNTKTANTIDEGAVRTGIKIFNIAKTGLNIRNFYELAVNYKISIPLANLRTRYLLDMLTESGFDGILDAGSAVDSAQMMKIISLKPGDRDDLKILQDRYQEIKMLLNKIKQSDITDAYLNYMRNILINFGISYERIEAICNSIHETHISDFTMTIDDFITLLERINRFRSITESGGVVYSDCMSIRGASFDHVFVIGLNQDEFPTQIYDDPLMPDDIRIKIKYTLGNHINIKRERFDEEKLLFYLSCKTAKKKLYFVYQRSDEKGVEATPSIFIEPLFKTHQVTEIPRSSYRLLSGANSMLSNHLKQLIRNRFKSIYETSAPTIFEGSLKSSAKQMQGATMNATRIKDFIECRFRYFLKNILKIEETRYKKFLKIPETTDRTKGNIIDFVIKEILAHKDKHHEHFEKLTPYLRTICSDDFIRKLERAIDPLLDTINKLCGSQKYKVITPKWEQTSVKGWIIQG
ncbi:MAG: exodeoxyribonuclease V subunit gamma, partial [Planctomycetes bacterium]|nr:exodeoxyribonuclease V subunit gamma [Planctomycetota bacterium]